MAVILFCATLFGFLEFGNAALYKFDSHPCYRQCTNETDRMTCGYNFTIEHYWTLSSACGACSLKLTDCFMEACIPANGYPRGVIVANRMLPGPAIRVCEGDRIVVDVRNKLIGHEVSVHWRGVSQRKTPWFDGVTGLSQCPIAAGGIFRYDFEADSAGTYSWHADSDFQRSDGLFGSLVVRKPKELELNGKFYDEDLAQHELIIGDWLDDSSLSTFLDQQYDFGAEFRSVDILVNGRGLSYDKFKQLGNGSLENPMALLTELRFTQGKRYRVRLINQAVLDCPIEMSITGHPFTIIAVDGNDVTPTVVSSLVSYSGERFDVVIKAYQPIGSYWIKFRGFHDCAEIFQLAVLNYRPIAKKTLPVQSIGTWEASAPEEFQNASRFDSLEMRDRLNLSVIGYKDLNALANDVELVHGVPKHQFYIEVGYSDAAPITTHWRAHHSKLTLLKGTKRLLPQFNFISNKMPVSPRSMTSLTKVNNLTSETTITEGSALICNESTTQKQNCIHEFCQCTHVLVVKVNATIEVVLVNNGNLTPTLHLHGNQFRVIRLETVNVTVTPGMVKSYEQDLIQRRNYGPLKDTVAVPPNGFTVFRFRSLNPGFWILRTTNLFMGELGASVIFKVGTDQETSPPSDFPRCGDFQPHVKTDIMWDTGIKLIEEPSTTTTTTTTTAASTAKPSLHEGHGGVARPNIPQTGRNTASGRMQERTSIIFLFMLLMVQNCLAPLLEGIV